MNPALAELRDIHLPPEPSWWPPAPGWWLLLAVGLALLVLLCIWLQRLYQRHRYRRQAVRELAVVLRSTPARYQPATINALLKRTALAAYPQQQTARLHGESWVRFLADTAPLPAPEIKALAALADAPYRPDGQPAQARLARAAEHWIRRHR